VRKLNIALIISEFEDSHTNTLCQGVAQAVRERGYQLYIFPTKFINAKTTSILNYDYEYHNNCLFHFVSENQIDIAIVNLGNIASNSSLEEKKRLLQMLHMPVILIADEMEGYSSVNFDNSTGMMFGIEHMMREHNKKYFGYVSGPMSNLDAVERKEVFEHAMIKNRFLTEQYRIVEGDFTYSCKDVIEKLLDDFPQIDVLICGNDMMCFGAYQVLEQRGLVPGKDIAVMGFDDVPYAAQVSPGLTTVKADPSLIGYEAVKVCEQVLQGDTFHLMVDTSFVIRESCGCQKHRLDALSTPLELQANIEALNHCLVDISRNVLNKEEENENIYVNILKSLAKLNIKSAYLYLFEEEVSYTNGGDWKKPNQVLLKAYYKDGAGRGPEIAYQPLPVYYYPVDEKDLVEVPEEKQLVSFQDILNNEHTVHMGQGIKVTTMLYAGEIQYGFIVWEVDEDYLGYIGKLSYQISNTIKTNRLLQSKNKITKELEEAIVEVNEKNAILEEISKIDDLTQTFNRRGFLDSMKRRVIAKENSGKRAIAVYADMNDLKKVNDEFGHEEGDFSLYSLGQILRDAVQAVGGKSAVGRIGGDEFCAYAITDMENAEQLLRDRLKELTEELNRHSGKPYYISMSLGVKQFECSSLVDISHELEQADERLYVDKQKKRGSIYK